MSDKAKRFKRRLEARMKINKMTLPSQRTIDHQIVGILAQSWYQKGLNIQDIADLIPCPTKDVTGPLADLLSDGLIKIAADLGRYEISERGAELWCDRTPE